MRTRHIVVYAMLASLLAVAGIVGIWFFTRPSAPLSPELEGPKLALEQMAPELRARPLFFTRGDIPALREHWKEWGAAFGAGNGSPEALAAEFEGTLQSPQAWRVLDRKWRFGAVLLTGEPAAFRPLLEHLRHAADWTLTRVAPSGYLFERSPARAWTVSGASSVLEVFKTHSPLEQRTARIQLAHRLMFLEEMTAAKGLLEEALALAPKSKEAWTEMAHWHGMAGDWNAANKAAEHALSLSRGYLPAQAAQAEALAALGRFDEALQITRDLYDALPADPQILLLHAKVTHGAHAYDEEITVLQRLIGLLQGRSQSVGFWQLYLGQAYAATGRALLAEDQFKAALKDPGLSPSDREFALKALDQLETKSDTLSTAPAPSPSPSSLLDAPPYRP
ncbi:MAG: hypothetical protein PHQ12_02790 [Chthoniobacteraceae bacterium]|nr:hypothetical protein [Chthoniobacteraceae bacterium]